MSAFPISKNDLFTVQKIRRLVCEEFNMLETWLDKRDRRDCVCFPRQIAMYLCRVKTDLTTTHIGKLFGNRDHGTILFAVRQVENRVETETKMKSTVANILNRL